MGLILCVVDLHLVVSYELADWLCVCWGVWFLLLVSGDFWLCVLIWC